MSSKPLIEIPPERRTIEQRHAQEVEEGVRASERELRRVFWQCVALTFAGVPIYAWSWHLTDPRQSQLAATAGFVVSYAVPFFRWLAFHVRRSEEFNG